MSSVPERIKQARVALGFSHAEMADAVSMNLPSYYDLESQSDEWETAVELSQLVALSQKLETPLFRLIGEEEADVTPTSFEHVASLIAEAISAERIQKEDLSWDIDEFFEEPSIAAEYPILFFRQIGEDVGFDWRAPILGYERRTKAAQPARPDNAG